MAEPASLAERLAGLAGRPAAWDTVAPGWERQRAYLWEISHDVGERLVAALAPGEGETVLELAAGPGDTGFLASPRLGPSGRLISTDVAPEMVAVAKHRGQELGLTNVDYRVVDAQAIDLPDQSVDGVLCRWGYMLVPEPPRALAETRRVLRSGRSVSFAVWGESRENPWGTAVGRALLELELIEQPDPDAPGPFRLGDAECLRSLVRDAGFEEPEIVDVRVAWRHASFEDFWSVTSDLSFLVTTAADVLEPDVLAEVKQRTARLLSEFTAKDGRLEVPALCRNVLARRM